MNSNKFSYQGQIETILHYLNSMIQKNWTGKTADEFNRLMSIPELAKIACMSARNLQLMFKAYTSETIHQYIIRTRMEYAQQLLKDNKKSIAEIYEYIGFANQSALNNTLQKKYNLTPRELQKKLLETSHTGCCLPVLEEGKEESVKEHSPSLRTPYLSKPMTHK